MIYHRLMVLLLRWGSLRKLRRRFRPRDGQVGRALVALLLEGGRHALGLRQGRGVGHEGVAVDDLDRQRPLDLRRLVLRLRMDRDGSDAEPVLRPCSQAGIVEVLEGRPGQRRGYLRQRVEIEDILVVAEVSGVHVRRVSPANSRRERPPQPVDVGYDGVDAGEAGAATPPWLVLDVEGVAAAPSV